MNFEISIQGPKAHIIKLYRQLKPFSPRLRKLPDLSDEEILGRLEIVLTRNLEPSRLDQELLSVSNATMRAAGKETAEGGLFDIRVRNLDYSEPCSGSDGFIEPFRPTSSLLVEPWSPRLGRHTEAGRIYLDPGHAFGTGKHPTTRLCLQIMESIIHDGPTIERTLDFGCGTGILALAAVRLGARLAIGVEMDGASVKTANRNARLNRLEKQVKICEGSWDAVKGSFDLILANLVASALIRIGDRMADHLEDHGRAVVSGFGVNQVAEILPVLEKSGLVLAEQHDLEGWAGLLFRKETSRKSVR